MFCAAATDVNARVIPIISALMRLVLFIDLLEWVLECGAMLNFAPTFRECRVMVTRTRCNFFGADDDRFGYNTSQSTAASA
jgi:hypothetical protein